MLGEDVHGGDLGVLVYLDGVYDDGGALLLFLLEYFVSSHARVVGVFVCALES